MLRRCVSAEIVPVGSLVTCRIARELAGCNEDMNHELVLRMRGLERPAAEIEPAAVSRQCSCASCPAARISRSRIHYENFFNVIAVFCGIMPP